jgi:F0F1-type ATP synthase membrane subunit c/vacuolar-type H+-ATPase subunit K
VFVTTLVLSIYQGQKSRWVLQNGDAAGFVDLFRPMGIYEYSSFTYGSSALQLMEIIGKGPINFNSADLLNTQNNFNIFNSHAYLLSYLFRPISMFIDSVTTLPLLLVCISYVSGFYFLFRLGRYSNMRKTDKLIAYTILISSPILFEGIIGQPYMDRLFFGPCIALMLIVESKNFFGWKSFILTGILMISTALISERAALMIGIIISAQLIFSLRNSEFRKRESYLLIFLSALMVTWYFIWTAFFSTNPNKSNATFSLISGNLTALISGNRQDNFQKMLIYLLPFLIIGILKRKYFLILLIAVLPNFMFSIGGAELTGFATHYHALYLPVLAFLLFSKSYLSDKDFVNLGSRCHVLLSLNKEEKMYGTYKGTGSYGDALKLQQKIICPKFTDPINEFADFSLYYSSKKELESLLSKLLTDKKFFNPKFSNFSIGKIRVKCFKELNLI